MAKPYNHKEIEGKWQKFWEEKSVYKTENPSIGEVKPKYYVLDMFPYPSGAGLHVGHPRGYIGSDVLSRMRRMQGFNVLHPMGFDAFGLPAEQYAIQTGEHPSVITEKAIDTYKKQLEIIGLSYDWSREVRTIDPLYYKWTQWIFLKLFDSYFDEVEKKAKPISELVAKFEKEDSSWGAKSEKEKEDLLMNYRLAYEGYSEVNWCPELGTVLANDEIVDGGDGKPVSERGGFPVEKKNMRQWFLRITAYADRLLSGLESIDWPEHIKEIQRNWIGRSEGAEIEFSLKDSNEKIILVDAINTLFDVEFNLNKELFDFLLNISERKIVVTNAKEENLNKIKKSLEGGNFEIFSLFGNPDKSNPEFFEELFNQKNIKPENCIYFDHKQENIDSAKKIGVIKTSIFTNNQEAIKFINKEIYSKIKVFTTRPDTLFGVTFVAMPGEKEKFTGSYAINPANGEEVPIWEAPYVMEGYGTGAVMGVPAHDERDFEFAKRNGLEIKCVIYPSSVVGIDNSPEESYNKTNQEKELTLNGKICYSDFSYLDYLVNSNNFNDLKLEEAKSKITEFVGGKMVTKYKMRDAIFARQRYWGEPIPLKRVDGLINPLSENELPLELPNVSSYKPAGNGESPLAGVSEWVEKGFETNTMPGWAGSSWYFLRYMDPKNSEAFAGKDAVEYWQDVDVYVGGAEHATGHLLYSRFWHKFLYDLGYVPTDEPFKLLKNQGLILASDGRKMSKRWGNVVNPDEMVDRFGADSFRLYEMFIGPFDQYTSWNTDGLVGTRRFLERVWDITLSAKFQNSNTTNTEIDILLNKTIKKITEDIENFRFNTSVSSMMIFVNKLKDENKDSYSWISIRDLKKFLQILAPFAPHMTEDLWYELGETSSIHKSNWPKADESKLKDEKIKIAVQVNGKVRDEIEISPDASEEEVKELALSKNNISEIIKDQSIKKFIYVKGKIVNIVI